MWTKALISGGAIAGTGACLYAYANGDSKSVVHASVQSLNTKEARRRLPTRKEQLDSLKKEQFDILVVGGGATGCGVALDSVSRGMKTALVELEDFGSGTSSRSTKLIHGGVRYLQKAIMGLDYEQYKMVKEALHERYNLLQIAPHLSCPLPIMLPVYKWWQVPYFWVGIKAYDMVAGSKNLEASFFLSRKDALKQFPMLKKEDLKGAIVYYDGQHNDARMNTAIALTATRLGATIANHVAVTKLHKKQDLGGAEVITGARVKDQITGEEWDVQCKCVINATGPFTDSLRKMDNPKIPSLMRPSMGVHIVLPGYYSPVKMGLLDPATSDGRVIFFLPWQNNTIAGTTDTPCEVTHNPAPTEEDIQFILNEVRNYLNKDVIVRRGDVLSAWSGIRPLVLDPSKADTQSIARNHIVDVSPSGLVTISGGKWTTYRSMAVDTVDAAIKAHGLDPPHESRTDGLLLEGAIDWTPTLYIRLVQDFGVESAVAQNLASQYGDRAFSVAKLATLTGKRWPVIGKRLHEEFPYITAEVRYAVREYAMTAVDVIARRIRLAFLNVQAAREALPVIVDIMADELGWSKEEKERQMTMATQFICREMGANVNRTVKEKIPINFTRQEMADHIKKFQQLDKDSKGYISVHDLRNSLKRTGIDLTGLQMHALLSDVEVAHNGQVELQDYLQMMSAMKTGTLVHSRFATMALLQDEDEERKKRISVERSCGGL